VCIVGPKPVFALYSHDERPRKTIRARHDLEKSVRRPGLGVFRHSVSHFFIILLEENEIEETTQVEIQEKQNEETIFISPK
jgi:hypothetical protein